MQEIVGTKIRIDSVTLKQHLQFRHAFHTEQANKSVEAYKELRKLYPRQGFNPADNGKLGLSGAASAYLNSTQSHLDPANPAREDAIRHERRAAYFVTMSKYLIPDAHYTLTDSEMDNLELGAGMKRQLDLD